MTSPRLQFSPMDDLRAKIKTLQAAHDQAMNDGNEELALTIYSSICEVRNRMQDLGKPVDEAVKTMLTNQVRSGFPKNSMN